MSEPTGQAEIRVVHQTGRFVVIDKPAGFRSVPGLGPDGQACVVNAVRALFPGAAGPLSVHRLDMATSGLVVMARGAAAQRQLSEAFARRVVDKRYTAVVSGHPVVPADSPDGWAVIDLPLLPDWPNRPLSKVDPVHGKPSITRWQRLVRDGGIMSD